MAAPERANPIVIGERINPCGNPRLAARLAAGDWDAVDEEARAQAAAGADLLDVNGALPANGGSEHASLFEMIDRAERAADLPLVIDSRHAWILVQAAERVRRPPILSSLAATREALERWLPELARTGAPVVGLAIDEGGVPAGAAERFACAESFVRAGLALGMPLEHLIVDCVALPGGEEPVAANAPALDAMRLVSTRLGAPLILGISNVSHGAPTTREHRRRAAAFLVAALDAGLDYAIVNPLDEKIRSMLPAARRERGQAARSHERPA